MKVIVCFYYCVFSCQVPFQTSLINFDMLTVAEVKPSVNLLKLFLFTVCYVLVFHLCFFYFHLYLLYSLENKLTIRQSTKYQNAFSLFSSFY